MVVARLVIGIFLLLVVVLFFVECQAVMRVEKLEKTWAENLLVPSPKRLSSLRKDILRFGGCPINENQSTKIAFEGTSENFVVLVNRLLGEPFEWSRWSCERASGNFVQGSITLKNVTL